MNYKIIKYKNKAPIIEKDVFIADGVKIIGDVQIDEQTSVWYNSVIRGDVNFVKSGQNIKIGTITSNDFPQLENRIGMVVGSGANKGAIRVFDDQYTGISIDAAADGNTYGAQEEPDSSATGVHEIMMGHDGPSYAKQILMRYADSGFKVFTYHGRDTHDDTDDAEYIKLQPGKSGSITMCEDSGSGGFVGIGTTRPKTLLHVNGCISGSIIRSKGDIIAFSSSDITLKDNLTKITNPIEKLQA